MPPKHQRRVKEASRDVVTFMLTWRHSARVQKEHCIPIPLNSWGGNGPPRRGGAQGLERLITGESLSQVFGLDGWEWGCSLSWAWFRVPHFRPSEGSMTMGKQGPQRYLTGVVLLSTVCVMAAALSGGLLGN